MLQNVNKCYKCFSGSQFVIHFCLFQIFFYIYFQLFLACKTWQILHVLLFACLFGFIWLCFSNMQELHFFTPKLNQLPKQKLIFWTNFKKQINLMKNEYSQPDYTEHTRSNVGSHLYLSETKKKENDSKQKDLQTLSQNLKAYVKVQKLHFKFCGKAQFPQSFW